MEQRWLRAAQHRWPQVRVDDARFSEAVTTIQVVDEATALDLYLALGCSTGDRAALRAFEAAYFGGIGSALGRMGLGPAEIEDVTQAVRERLFIDEVDGRTRVIAAVGRGDLGALVKMAAVRIALNAARGEARRGQRELAATDWDPGLEDPEVQLLRADEKAAFKAAFEETIAQLEARARNVLRLHLVEKLSIDQIGAVLGVHRSSAARWLRAAREEVARGTEEALRARLARPARELGEALALVRSRLDLSLSRLLGGEDQSRSAS